MKLFNWLSIIAVASLLLLADCSLLAAQGNVMVFGDPYSGGWVTGGGKYKANTVVTINAYSSNGWTFVQWQDALTNSTRKIVVKPGKQAYTASFSPAYGTIIATAQPTDGGTVTGGGNYAVGSQAFIAAVPNRYWQFYNWSDGGSAPSRTVTVQPGTFTYVANFTEYGTLTVTAEPTNGGTVSGAGSYSVGTLAVINAAPAINWFFVQWQDGNTNLARQIAIPSGTVQMTATFSTNPPARVNATVKLPASAVPSTIKNWVVSWGGVQGNYTNSLMSTVTSPVVISNLLAYATYYFVAQAVDTNGQLSVYSCEVAWKSMGTTSCP